MSSHRFRNPYSEELKEQVVSLHRQGRSIASLAREFEPSEPTISAWIKAARHAQAALASDSSDAPASSLHEVELAELLRL